MEASGLLDAALIAFADALHARGDARAREAGLSVARDGRTGRRYRALQFDELAARRTRREASRAADKLPLPAA